MSNNEELIRQFCETTGCPPDRSRFYLESAGWEIGVALETYFDSRGSQEDDVNMEDYSGQQSGPAGGAGLFGMARQAAQHFVPGLNPAATAAGPSNQAQRPVAVPKPKPTGGTSGPGRIATLSSLRGRQSTDEEDDDQDDDDKEQGQEFYVGSGQEVIGPGKKRNPDELISSVFNSARQHGAEQMSEESRPAGRTHNFAGAGQRIDGVGATAPLGNNAIPVQPGAPPDPNRGPVVLRMWQNGFTINDGPLRRYDDPANQEFMNSVKQGRMPLELAMLARAGDVKMQMEDHRDEEYRPPKKAAEYFGGTGHMLGSPAPAVLSNPSASKKPETGDQRKSSEEKAKAAYAVDGAVPATNLQIRLTDGSRMVHRFSETATVGDVRQFIRMARPELETTQFQILAGFPSKPLSDDSASLKDANLLNAAIQVK